MLGSLLGILGLALGTLSVAFSCTIPGSTALCQDLSDSYGSLVALSCHQLCLVCEQKYPSPQFSVELLHGHPITICSSKFSLPRSHHKPLNPPQKPSKFNGFVKPCGFGEPNPAIHPQNLPSEFGLAATLPLSLKTLNEGEIELLGMPEGSAYGEEDEVQNRSQEDEADTKLGKSFGEEFGSVFEAETKSENGGNAMDSISLSDLYQEDGEAQDFEAVLPEDVPVEGLDSESVLVIENVLGKEGHQVRSLVEKTVLSQVQSDGQNISDSTKLISAGISDDHDFLYLKIRVTRAVSWIGGLLVWTAMIIFVLLACVGIRQNRTRQVLVSQNIPPQYGRFGPTVPLVPVGGGYPYPMEMPQGKAAEV